jgi:hypothetical protein
VTTPEAPERLRASHKGPPLGIVGAIFVLLFLAGLYPVTAFNGTPAFPGPYEPLPVIMAYFVARPSAVLLCAALHFGASIPLGIFTATAVSRLRFLGVRAAGADIAFFGGFLTAFTMMVSSSVLWAMTYQDVVQHTAVLQALFRIQFALGGPGFSVPFGLLAAGVSVTSGFRGALPKWVILSGLAIAAIGELSWLEILFPKLLPLIPLTRFPGFAWLMMTGFLLPRFVEKRVDRSIEVTT